MSTMTDEQRNSCWKKWTANLSRNIVRNGNDSNGFAGTLYENDELSDRELSQRLQLNGFN